MRTPSDKTKTSNRPEWASLITRLRRRLGLSQTTFGQEVHSSAMGVSRWERGAQEPPSHSYIELGNLAGDPDCWYFWGRAGLRSEDLMRVLPKLRNRHPQPSMQDFEFVHAGTSSKKPGKAQLVAIPLLKIVADTNAEKGDNIPILHEAPIESLIAAPKDWCPNPTSTYSLRVRGNSMNPLIYADYILVVDSSQTNRTKLDGKIVIAWHKDVGLTVSRFRRYDHTEVLHPENREFDAITLDRKNSWKIIAKVLWWIGKAP
jgi:SOS-response transcriptional repressor LexA/DNA-binding XRE family transcriptional regulator